MQTTSNLKLFVTKTIRDTVTLTVNVCLCVCDSPVKTARCVCLGGSVFRCMVHLNLALFGVSSHRQKVNENKMVTDARQVFIYPARFFFANTFQSAGLSSRIKLPSRPNMAFGHIETTWRLVSSIDRHTNRINEHLEQTNTQKQHSTTI